MPETNSEPDTAPLGHTWAVTPRKRFVCQHCSLQRIPSESASGWIFRTRKGTVSATEPACRPRAPRHAQHVLAMASGSPSGLTASQLASLLGFIPEAQVLLAVKQLERTRMLRSFRVGDAVRFVVDLRGARWLSAQADKLAKRPVGRPRVRPIGYKRVYQSNGRPRGRPRKYPDVAAPTPRADGAPVGRPRQFDDADHARARAAAARRHAAHKPTPKKLRLRDMTTDQRDAYYAAQRARAVRVARSWRRWEAAKRLADRHLASAPPLPQELSPDARAWLSGARS